jgi:hypothetical protein
MLITQDTEVIMNFILWYRLGIVFSEYFIDFLLQQQNIRVFGLVDPDGSCGGLEDSIKF